MVYKSAYSWECVGLKYTHTTEPNTGVYPVYASAGASKDALVYGEASSGQGARCRRLRRLGWFRVDLWGRVAGNWRWHRRWEWCIQTRRRSERRRHDEV